VRSSTTISRQLMGQPFGGILPAQLYKS